MHYRKKMILFGIAYSIITPYNFLYATEEIKIENNKKEIKFVSIKNHNNNITTTVQDSFEYTTDKEKEIYLKGLANFLFPSNNRPFDENNEQLEYKHEIKKNKQLYRPLVEFIDKKTRPIRELILLYNGISSSIYNSPFVSIQNLIKAEISLKDPELIKLITNISKDGFDDPLQIHRFLLLSSLHKYFIKGINEYAAPLVRRIINEPLKSKFIKKEDMPSYMDVNNPGNNFKNQFEILFANTDFDCNTMIHDKVDRYSLEVSYTCFAELLMNLSINKEINSLPIVEQWLDKGADANVHSIIKDISNEEAFKSRTPFKIAVDLLREQSIECTDPKKMITVFLAKKADSNAECLDIKRENNNVKPFIETPFAAFIDALNKNKILLKEEDRNDLITLFLKSGANKAVLNNNPSCDLLKL